MPNQTGRAVNPLTAATRWLKNNEEQKRDTGTDLFIVLFQGVQFVQTLVAAGRTQPVGKVNIQPILEV
jgi:hypothetical protein